MIPRRYPALLFSIAALLATSDLRFADTVGTTWRAERAPLVDSDDEIARLTHHQDYVAALDLAQAKLRRRLAEGGPRDAETLDALHSVAWLLHWGGDNTSADQATRIVLELREQVAGGDDVYVARTLILVARLARLYVEPERLDDALTRARNYLEPRRDRLWNDYASLLIEEGNANRWVDLDTCIAKYREAVALRRSRESKLSFRSTDDLVWLAWTLYYAGEQEEAMRLSEQAADELAAHGSPDHGIMMAVLGTQAEDLAIAGKWQAAETLLRRSLRIKERFRNGLLPGLGTVRVPLKGYEVVAYLELMQDRGAAAWSSLQRMRNNVSYDFVRLARWRDRDLASFTQASLLRERLNDFEEQLQRAEGDSPEARLAVLLDKLATRLELARLERRYLRSVAGRDVELEQLQASLDDSSAYVGWLSYRIANLLGRSSGPIIHGSWMYVIRNEGPIRWVPLWETDRVDADKKKADPTWGLSARLLRAAEWPLRVDVDPELLRSSRQVADVLFAPGLPHLDGVERLIIEFSTAHPRTPLELFVGPDGRYIGDRYDTTYVPSAASYLELLAERNSRHVTERPALVLGDAVFSGRHAHQPLLPTRLDAVQLRRALNRDPRALDRLPRLPRSGEEARQIAARFPDSTLLLGADASERRLSGIAREEELERFGVVHIATHTLIDCHAERSALALSRLDLDGSRTNDGLLQADEIMLGWRLDADLLTLSGCQSARGCGWDDGQYVGFTQALLGVGARSVLASMWKVDDQATALLMDRFYENLSGTYQEPRRGRRGVPMTKSAALAEARGWLRGYTLGDGSRPFEHPVYWAGFVLFGVD